MKIGLLHGPKYPRQHDKHSLPLSSPEKPDHSWQDVWSTWHHNEGIPGMNRAFFGITKISMRRLYHDSNSLAKGT